MRAYKDSLQALDDRVCRGVGGENDARNEGFDDLRKLYRCVCGTGMLSSVTRKKGSWRKWVAAL